MAREGAPSLVRESDTPVDAGVANEWGRLMARRGSLPAIDGLIAATALHHRLAVVTRNVSDFAASGVDLLNPWKADRAIP